MNGDLLRATGRGVERLDPRELCDLSYAAIVGGIEKMYFAQVAAGAKWEDTDDPLGDMIAKFEEKAGLRDNPEQWALMMHKRWMEERGIPWDDTPVGAGNGQWWDQNVEFTRMEDLDAPARKKEAVSRNRALFKPKDKEVL